MPREQKLLFLRELELMMRSRHPIVQVHRPRAATACPPPTPRLRPTRPPPQFLGYDEPFVISMEYLPAGDLRQYWRRHHLNTSKKVDICIDVLAYLHNRRPAAIIHRDVKPTNVLMTTRASPSSPTSTRASSASTRPTTCSRPPRPPPRRRPRLRPLRRPRRPDRAPLPPPDEPTTPYTPPEEPAAAGGPQPEQRCCGRGCRPPALANVGTERYMAPEASTPRYTTKVDIYGAGVTFYELFEGASFDPRQPFAMALTPSKVEPLDGWATGPKSGCRRSS